MDEQIPSDVSGLRKGKWTTEEENYANKIIQLFSQGLLPIVVGTTLRSYLSEKLNCDPMRITKKFAGASCIGKQVFQSCPRSPDLEMLIMKGVKELEELERDFLKKLMSKGGGSIVYSSKTDELFDEATNVRGKHHSSRYDINTPSKPTAAEQQHGTSEDSYSVTSTGVPTKTASKGSRSRVVLLASDIVNTAVVPSTVDFAVHDAASKIKRMKRVMSAPDFLSYDKFDLKQPSRMTSGQTVDPTLRTTGGAGMHLSNSRPFTGSGQPFFSFRKRTKRSHSVMDFEHYFSSDQAAGELLLDFYNGLQNTSSFPHSTKRATVADHNEEALQTEQVQLRVSETAGSSANCSHKTNSTSTTTESLGNVDWSTWYYGAPLSASQSLVDVSVPNAERRMSEHTEDITDNDDEVSQCKDESNLDSPRTRTRTSSSLETPGSPTPDDRTFQTDAETTIHIPHSAFRHLNMSDKQLHTTTPGVSEKDKSPQSVIVKQESFYSAFTNRKRSDSSVENPVCF